MAHSPQLKRFEKRLAAIPARARQAVRPALEKSGDELAATMRVLVPEAEGDLKDSIEVSDTEFELAVQVTAGTDNAGDANHAKWIEYGTVEMDPQPFFNPAVRLLKKRIDRRIKSAITKAIKKEFHK